MGELIRLAAELPEATFETLATERLEADICQLAGNIAAAECRFLMLVGEYDARGGYTGWDMPSCAARLAWKCQLAPGTAREHVRVARALRVLPVIRREFAAGRMSYSKARALTRIAEPDTEAILTELTRCMTAGQAERFARAHHRVSEYEKNKNLPGPGVRTRFSYRIDPDTGELAFSGHLPPEQAAVLLKALRAATDPAATGDGDSDEAPDHGQDGAGQRPEPFKVTPADLAEALTELAAAYLRGKIVSADNADIYQVVIHTTPQVLTQALGQDPADVPAGTPADSPGPGHPAEPGRCHLEDGDALPGWKARLAACTATLQVMVHDTDGQILTIGRRSRKPTPRIRKAVRERDRYRCVFPGCGNRRTDLHHIRYWTSGGETSTDNMCLLCSSHHTLVHRRGYLITRHSDNTYTFTSPDGTTILPPAWQLPPADRDISGTHQADITAMTIYPPNSGERLDLNLAIWIAFHNTTITRQKAALARQEPAAAAA